MPVQAGFQRVFFLVDCTIRKSIGECQEPPSNLFRSSYFTLNLYLPRLQPNCAPRQCLQIYAAQYQKPSRVPWTAEAFSIARPAQPGAEPSRRVGTITTASAPAPLAPAAPPLVEEDKGDTTSDTSLPQQRRPPWLMRGRTYHRGSGSCMRR